MQTPVLLQNFLPFNSLYGIQRSYDYAIEILNSNFQFPLWDTSTGKATRTILKTILSIPFMGYLISFSIINPTTNLLSIPFMGY